MWATPAKRPLLLANMGLSPAFSLQASAARRLPAGIARKENKSASGSGDLRPACFRDALPGPIRWVGEEEAF